MEENNENHNDLLPDTVHGCMIFIGLILAGLSFLINSTAVLVIGIILSGLGVFLAISDGATENDELLLNQERFQRRYDAYARELKVVKSDKTVTLLIESVTEIPHYIWIENDCLNLFPTSEYYKRYYTRSDVIPEVSELKLINIPLLSILYFEEIGELRKYSIVTGGEISSGAWVRYYNGDTGRPIPEPIRIKNISEDNRAVELIYYNQTDNISNLEFRYDAYITFKALIPMKEFRKIVNLNAIYSIDDATRKIISCTAKEKLKELNTLKADGLITEKDFMNQKQN